MASFALGFVLAGTGPAPARQPEKKPGVKKMFYVLKACPSTAEVEVMKGAKYVSEGPWS